MCNYRKRPLISPRLMFLRKGFRRAYKQRGLHPRGAYINRNRKRGSKQVTAVLIKIRFASISNSFQYIWRGLISSGAYKRQFAVLFCEVSKLIACCLIVS